jgi:hypothetical protein
MANDFADRIARLKDKKNKLAGQLGALEQKAKAASRKLDTRRKIIVGGAVLAHMEKDATFASAMQKLLGAYVGRPLDREAIADLLAPKSPPAIQQAPPPAPSAPRPAPAPAEQEVARLLGRTPEPLNFKPQTPPLNPAPASSPSVSATYGYKPE